MLFVSRPRKLVIQAPFGWLALAIVLGLYFASLPRLDRVVWVFPVMFFLVAVGTVRVAARLEKQIVVWGVLGQKRFSPAHTFVAVLTRPGIRGSSVSVELMVGDQVALIARSACLGTYMPLGTDRVMEAARRIAAALELHPPRLAPWLDPGGAAARRWKP